MEKPDEADFHDFPTREETEDAFGTLIGWCVGQGMSPGKLHPRRTLRPTENIS